MFYWLVEPQYDQRNAPVLLWLSGGPGCSGSGALLTENGPFLVNPDGRTLFENVFSWNKAAYVIYLDSPRGVGFSYQNQTENSDNNEWNDPLSAADIVSAIKQIYQIYPVLSERRFYLTGESYAGVYVPTVASQLIKELEKGEHGPFSGLGINLRGIAIGNGFFSFKWIFSTHMDEIRKCCQPLNELYCHIPEDSDCDLLKDGFMERFLAIRNHIDSFNIYRQCYQRQNSDDQDATNILLNYGSNDASFGFPCYALNSVEKYLSQAHVRESLHVPDFVQKWKFCNDTINQKYDHTYFDAAKDMGETFKEILSSNYVLENTEEPFRILAYNGDSDLVCSFLEAEFFLEQLVEEQKTKSIGKKTAAKHPWYYSQTPNISVVAGFHKSYSFSSSSSNAVVASLDFLTVKGAGHFAAVDRSGPTLQMISNFVGKNINYSQPLKYPLMRSHLKSQYEPNPASQNSPNRGSVPALSSASPPSPLTTTQDSTTLTSGAQKSKDCFLIRLICFFLIVNLF
uniref:Carboxypeptidase n=1 Tax=Ditylenchus dipsaci TaxID=166011 RepID=A0A915D7U0_9BILA